MKSGKNAEALKASILFAINSRQPLYIYAMTVYNDDTIVHHLILRHDDIVLVI